MNEVEMDNISVEKYLKALVVINATLGKLDVLKLHLKSTYDDKMSDAIIENIIQNLSDISGVHYKTINVNIPQRKPITEETKQIVKESNLNIGYAPARPEPCVIEVLEDTTPEPTTAQNVQENINKYKNFANANLQAEKITKKVNKAKKVINESEGVKIDDETGNYTYKFVNSSTLDYMIYNKTTKILIMAFLRNGRVYEYKQIPMFLFDNLHFVDENGESAGSYFQQNVVKNEKWSKKSMYREITDIMLIG